jgi:ADP-L-glycero-D-manno-heptose 6-epimerase
MIIITGGAGFIGSNCVATLAQATDEPLVVCDFFGADEKWQNIKHVTLEDILAPEELFDFLALQGEDVSTIVHMGAISSTMEKDVGLIVDQNFKLSKDLFEWCAENKKRLIYASSAATYGDGALGFVDGYDPLHLTRLNPLNAYGWSKNMFDRFVAARIARKAPMPPQCVGLKFFNVYGPNEYHKGNQVSVVWQLYHQVKDGKTSAKLFKSYKKGYDHGGQLRDFVSVMDCCKVLVWLYKNPQVTGLLNVGTGQARSFKDLAESVFTALKQAPRIDYIDMPEGLAEKYQYYTQADLTHLRAAGYKEPFMTLEEGVKEYITYLVKEDPYR